jgi:hypothetical protein
MKTRIEIQVFGDTHLELKSTGIKKLSSFLGISVNDVESKCNLELVVSDSESSEIFIGILYAIVK